MANSNPLLLNDTTCVKLQLQEENFEELEKVLVLIKCFSMASSAFAPGMDKYIFKNCLLDNSIALNDTLLTDIFFTATPEECGGIVESSDPEQRESYPTQYQVNIYIDILGVFHKYRGLFLLCIHHTVLPTVST